MIATSSLVPLARGGTCDLFTADWAGKPVVVKIARDATSRLDAEAAMLEQLSSLGAPRLVGRTRVGERDALVLEYLGWPALRSARVEPQSTALAVGEAVAALHDARVVHADLTPENILVSPDGRAVQLIDFGVAANVGERVAPLATIGYAAPERHAPACVATPALDVYALGVICFELFAGSAPFAGAAGERRVSHVARRVPRLQEHVAVPAEVDAAIARAMAKAPAERGTARELVTALRNAPWSDAQLRRRPHTSTVAPLRRAILVGFSWHLAADDVRAAVDEAGGTLVHCDGGRHVAAFWHAEAPRSAACFVDMLRGRAAGSVATREADVRIGPSGIVRGVAIAELARGVAEPAVVRVPELSAFVGRESTLRDIVAIVRGGQGALVTVLAPAGFGKSRLLAELRARLGADERERVELVDDAHAADPRQLDAIEHTTGDPEQRRVVIACARPSLLVTRPRWGRRAACAHTIVLEPLDRDQGRELVRALLPPTAATPGPLIDQIVARCGGVPLHIVEVVAALVRANRGGVPTRGALPTDAELPAGLLGWAAEAELAELTPGARAVAETLAVADVELGRPEVAMLLGQLDADGITLELEPAIALRELVTAGLLHERERLVFRHPLIREAIVARVDETRRRAIHRAMVAHACTARDRAHHAEGAGERAIAVAAWSEVADRAHQAHDDLELERALGRMLACGVPTAAILRRRGAARTRLGRDDAAGEDFAAARVLASGDRRELIEVLLDEATARDWRLDYAAAASCSREAAALARSSDPALLRARVAMALGRTAWREGRALDAVAPLRDALALACALGDDGYETRVACRLMLAFMLDARVGVDIDEAARFLDDVQREATARGDLQHVAAAHCNRFPLHAMRGDLAGARADLTAFAAAGREMGVAVTEYRGELYLALLALWIDDDATAMRHATAARRIESADRELCPRPRAALALGLLAARARDRDATRTWCETARTSATRAPIDDVVLAALDAWCSEQLDLDAARTLAHTAVELGESEAGYLVLSLVSRDDARRLRGLPRFIPGLEVAS